MFYKSKNTFWVEEFSSSMNMLTLRSYIEGHSEYLIFKNVQYFELPIKMESLSVNWMKEDLLLEKGKAILDYEFSQAFLKGFEINSTQETVFCIIASVLLHYKAEGLIWHRNLDSNYLVNQYR